MVKRCGQELWVLQNKTVKTPRKSINETCLSVFPSSVCLHSANTSAYAFTEMHAHTHTLHEHTHKPQWHIPVSLSAFLVTIIKPTARKKRGWPAKDTWTGKSSVETPSFCYFPLSHLCDLIKMCYLPSLCFVVISVSLQRDAGTEAVLLGQAVWPKGWRWEWFVWIISRVEFTITLNKQC